MVTGGEDCCCALESKLHPFIALALDVIDWEILFAFCVRDGQDLRGLVNSTFEWALIASRVLYSRVNRLFTPMT